jgi:hypothetical protein
MAGNQVQLNKGHAAEQQRSNHKFARWSAVTIKMTKQNKNKK